MKYLWDFRAEIDQRMRGRQIALFLDFDGTLADIAPVPKAAALPQKTKSILSRLSRKMNMAIISGRSLSDIRKQIRIPGIAYVGSHGLEYRIGGINRKSALKRPEREALRNIKLVFSRLRPGFPGMLLEDKGSILAVHYRRGSPQKRKALKDACRKIFGARVEARLKMVFNKMVTEFRPAYGWTKGQAVLHLLKNFGGKKSGRELLPIYIGDDLTDENAFIALRKKGLTIRVKRDRRSAAVYYLNNPADVSRFLESLRYGYE